MTTLKIGYSFSGTVDRVGNECIKTKFFALAIPLFPIESYYIIEEKNHCIKGFPIKLNFKSIILSYLRCGIPFFIFLFGLLKIFTHSVHFYFDVSLVFLSLIIWLITMFVMNRSYGIERKKRLLLKLTSGIYALPKMLPLNIASDIYDNLLKEWYSIKTANINWEETMIEKIDLNSLVLLFSIALYSYRITRIPFRKRFASECWRILQKNYN